MRIGNKKKPDFEAISRRSIKRDFYSERIYVQGKKMPQNENIAKINVRNEVDVEEGVPMRVSNINPICEYAKYARYFVGKLVRLINKKGAGDSTTGWYEFVHDEDRVALNQAAGWSDNKKMYLLERPKFKK